MNNRGIGYNYLRHKMRHLLHVSVSERDNLVGMPMPDMLNTEATALPYFDTVLQDDIAFRNYKPPNGNTLYPTEMQVAVGVWN